MSRVGHGSAFAQPAAFRERQALNAAAVGGDLTIESAPGEGSTVLGVIPRSRSGQWFSR